MARNLTPAERDAILERVVEGVVDGVDRLTAIESRLNNIEAATRATPSAILRESLMKIFDNTLKTASLFAFLTVCVIIAGAIYLNSEAALLAVAQRTSNIEPIHTITSEEGTDEQ